MIGSVCRRYHRNLQLLAALMLCLYSSIVGAQVAGFNLNDTTIPLFGVPLTVLVMAFGGSLVGFAHMPPVEPRKKLYTMILMNTLLGSWFVVLIPEWRGWTVSPVAQPPLAGVLSVVSVVVVPLIIKRLPDATTAIIDRFLDRIFKPTQGGGSQ